MKTPSRSISEIAYELWEKRGMPHGSAEQDWAEAERMASQPAATDSAQIDESSMESFPASDPPASHIADAPPSNAEAKWAAAGAQKKKASKR